MTAGSKELLEQEVLLAIQSFLEERGLELSQEKTKITHIEEGFDFLGQTIRKFNGKLIIKPAKNNLLSFLSKVRQIIKTNKQATAGNLILQLNPVIRGWANFHRHVVSKRTFGSVDHAIFKALWQWAIRRHRRKGKRWIKDKYFKVYGHRRWVFTGTVPDKNGAPRTIHLFHAVATPIQRHVKIQGQANPYDPQWTAYFTFRQRKLPLNCMSV